MEELDDGHGVCDGLNEDQVLSIWKRRKKNKMAQGKGILDRSIFVLPLKTPSGCEWI